MVPLIVGFGLLIGLIVLLLLSMVWDMFKTGFFVWHRDSAGQMIQYLLWSICLLSTVVHLSHFISEFEEGGYQISGIGPNG